MIEEDIKNTLSELYSNPNKDDFIAFVQSLRSNNWPLSAISGMMDLSKTTVSRWEKKSTPSQLPHTPEYPKNRHITPEDSQKLALLAQKASKVRGLTPPTAPSRVAQQELEQLLLDFYQNGVTVTELARHCNVTRRAIYQRLEKYDLS